MKPISSHDMIDLENVSLSRGTSRSSNPNQDTTLLLTNTNTNTPNKYTYVVILGIIIALGFIAWIFYLTLVQRK
jgi:hypothetical protein